MSTISFVAIAIISVFASDVPIAPSRLLKNAEFG